MTWGKLAKQWAAKARVQLQSLLSKTPTVSSRDLHTLDHWRDRLSGLPRTIECSSIELRGSDQHSPYFLGPGRIEIRSATKIQFFVYATAENPSSAFKKLVEAKQNPYDPLKQFQVHATDFQGTQWALGWTTPDYFADASKGWPLTGEVLSLSTFAKGTWVSKRSSVELLLLPAVDLPTTESLTTVSKLGNETVRWSSEAGQHIASVSGVTIKFTYEPDGQALWITADTNGNFRHPYAENWLTEPLRILLGTTIYPRMVARNMGDGTAHVWLRPSPGDGLPTFIGLCHPFSTEPGNRETFWELYSSIFTMIAKAKNFEAHPLTHLYVEMADASRGSRWVLTLTLASTVESLTKMLMTDEDKRSEYSDELLQSMKRHLRTWDGDATLRGRMLNSLGQIGQKSAMGFMRQLAANGVVRAEDVTTWSQVRNSVMHGEMVEPWSTEDGDAKLKELLDLVHDLSRALISRG